MSYAIDNFPLKNNEYNEWFILCVLVTLVSLALLLWIKNKSRLLVAIKLSNRKWLLGFYNGEKVRRRSVAARERVAVG